MVFPKDIADHHKENLTQKCFYLVNQFKAKDLGLWEKFKARLATLKPEESWDFYHELLVEYQKVVDRPDIAAQAPAAPTEKKAPAKNAEKKVAKKVVKKAAPKKAAKKVAKKAVKKAAPKKAAKKVAKKAAKKAAPKKAAKKAAPKKAAKKVAKKAKK